MTNRETLLHQLEQNERDLVIMGQPPKLEDLVASPFLENPLVVIAPPQHPLVEEKRIPIERLLKESFVLREKGSGTRSATEKYFAEQGADFPLGMEMSSNESIES